jgi:hypothetical protein
MGSHSSGHLPTVRVHQSLHSLIHLTGSERLESIHQVNCSVFLLNTSRIIHLPFSPCITCHSTYQTMAGTQQLPAWMTLPTMVITNAEGQPIATTTTTLELPLVYYGPSVSLDFHHLLVVNVIGRGLNWKESKWWMKLKRKLPCFLAQETS